MSNVSGGESRLNGRTANEWREKIPKVITMFITHSTLPQSWSWFSVTGSRYCLAHSLPKRNLPFRIRSRMFISSLDSCTEFTIDFDGIEASSSSCDTVSVSLHSVRYANTILLAFEATRRPEKLSEKCAIIALIVREWSARTRDISYLNVCRLFGYLRLALDETSIQATRSSRKRKRNVYALNFAVAIWNWILS